MVSAGNNSPVAPRKTRSALLGLGRNFATRAFPSVVFVKIPRLTPSPPLRSPAAQDGGRVLAQLLARRPRPRSERRGKVRSLSALGRAATRALPFPPSRAKARASSFFRRSVWESRPPLAPRARRAPPLTRAPSTSSTRRSPLIGGLDSLIHNDHWRCVAPPRPRPSRETRRWRKHKAVTWGSRNSSAGELFSPLCVTDPTLLGY